MMRSVCHRHVWQRVLIWIYQAQEAAILVAIGPKLQFSFWKYLQVVSFARPLSVCAS